MSNAHIGKFSWRWIFWDHTKVQEKERISCRHVFKSSIQLHKRKFHVEVKQKQQRDVPMKKCAACALLARSEERLLYSLAPCKLIQNPGLWNLEFSARNLEFFEWIQNLDSRIQVPRTGKSNPEYTAWNAQFKTVLDYLTGVNSQAKSSHTVVERITLGFWGLL